MSRLKTETIKIKLPIQFNEFIEYKEKLLYKNAIVKSQIHGGSIFSIYNLNLLYFNYYNLHKYCDTRDLFFKYTQSNHFHNKENLVTELRPTNLSCIPTSLEEMKLTSFFFGEAKAAGHQLDLLSTIKKYIKKDEKSRTVKQITLLAEKRLDTSVNDF